MNQKQFEMIENFVGKKILTEVDLELRRNVDTAFKEWNMYRSFLCRLVTTPISERNFSRLIIEAQDLLKDTSKNNDEGSPA